MNKSYNIQNTNICNGIFHISFFKALLINEGETTRGEMNFFVEFHVPVDINEYQDFCPLLKILLSTSKNPVHFAPGRFALIYQ
jgi:hypothetical protein